MPRRSNVLRSWRGGRNEPVFCCAPYLLRGSWGRSCPVRASCNGSLAKGIAVAVARCAEAYPLPNPSIRLYFAPVSRYVRGNYFAARTSSAFGSAYFFSAIKLKNLKRPWNQMAIAKIPSTLAATQGSAMSGSLLDECRKSIVKIAETQSPAGKRAILMMAEMFRSNSGRASADGRPSLSQDFHTPAQQPVRPHRLRSRRASR